MADGVEQIPAVLRSTQRWLLWNLEATPGGKPAKVPDQSTLDLARCRTWEAVKDRTRWSEGGIGYVTTGAMAWRLGERVVFLLFIDLDGCRDPRTGVVSQWACAIVEKCGASYTEVSPSGTGLRLLVFVRRLPENVRAMVYVPEVALPGVDKRPGLQLFGLGPAGYVTMTGKRLAATSERIEVVDDIEWLIDALLMRDDGPGPNGYDLPQGEGEAPTLDAITQAVSEHQHGEALIEGRWKDALPNKSASEAFGLLERFALDAANGHGATALRWLLTRTAWGRGEVDDSKDPTKYTREKWVARDLARIGGKTHSQRVDPQEVFEALETPTPTAAPAAPAKTPGRGVNFVELWKKEGPLVHLPTGIASLDALTGGGFVLGSRGYVIGAPDAGKTAFVVQIADAYARRGIVVGILGVDEEPGDVAMRLMQRRGFTREELERRSPETLARVEAAMQGLPLMLFDGETTIEQAAVAVHQRAKELHPGEELPPCVLIVDSVQTARLNKEGDDSLYKLVTQRVRALRAAASRYRMLVLSTSEMSRAAYRAKKSDEQIADMAAAKESGAIEFSARVLLSLRNVPDTHDVVELRVVKNKHGPSHRNNQDGIFLRFDRAAQEMREDGTFEPVDTEDRRRDEAHAKKVAIAGQLVTALQLVGDMGRNAAAKLLKLPNRVVDEIAQWLEETGGIVRGTAKKGGAKPMRVVLERLPVEVLAWLRENEAGNQKPEAEK